MNPEISSDIPIEEALRAGGANVRVVLKSLTRRATTHPRKFDPRCIPVAGVPEIEGLWVNHAAFLLRFTGFYIWEQAAIVRGLLKILTDSGRDEAYLSYPWGSRTRRKRMRVSRVGKEGLAIEILPA